MNKPAQTGLMSFQILCASSFFLVFSAKRFLDSASHQCTQTPARISAEAMNLARIHDKQKLHKFWEQKIERHYQMTGEEEARMKRSALSKLRNEWIQMLQIRSHTLNGNMNTDETKNG